LEICAWLVGSRGDRSAERDAGCESDDSRATNPKKSSEKVIQGIKERIRVIRPTIVMFEQNIES